MVEISLSGSGEGPGRATGRGYSTKKKAPEIFREPTKKCAYWYCHTEFWVVYPLAKNFSR